MGLCTYRLDLVNPIGASYTCTHFSLFSYRYGGNLMNFLYRRGFAKFLYRKSFAKSLGVCTHAHIFSVFSSTYMGVPYETPIQGGFSKPQRLCTYLGGGSSTKDVFARNCITCSNLDRKIMFLTPISLGLGIGLSTKITFLVMNCMQCADPHRPIIFPNPSHGSGGQVPINVFLLGIL